MPRLFSVHIMKTGGTSLNFALREHFSVDRSYPNGSRQVWMKADIDALLDRPDRHDYDFYHVHMPAWVADEVAPRHDVFTILREPVARTVSHLRQIVGLIPGDLDPLEIWEDPSWRLHLANYQVQMLSMTRANHHRIHNGDVDTGQGERDAEQNEAFLDEVMEAIWQPWSTANWSPLDRKDQNLGAARDRLDAMTLVGITEQLGSFGQRLADRYGWDDLPVPVVNATRDELPVSQRLVRSIIAEMDLDLELYEYARALALQ